jgi:hypothetical protein
MAEGEPEATMGLAWMVALAAEREQPQQEIMLEVQQLKATLTVQLVMATLAERGRTPQCHTRPVAAEVLEQ